MKQIDFLIKLENILSAAVEKKAIYTYLYNNTRK